MAAAALIGNVPLTEVTRNVLDVVIRAQEKILGPLNPTFNLNNLLKVGLILFIFNKFYSSMYLL